MSTPSMTTRERMTCMFEHREADRVPIIDLPWASTIARWEREGMPTSTTSTGPSDLLDVDRLSSGGDWTEYLGADRAQMIGTDNSPRFPMEMIDATDEYRIYTTMWGATRKDWYETSGALGYLDYKIKDPDSWAKAKERMEPSRDRIDWARLERHYAEWRQRGDWIKGLLWFGFEVMYSHMVGDELFIAMVTQPEWVVDMVDTMLDSSIAMLEMVWDAGYHFDEVMWYNDMGYKHSQFISVDMYRELFKPADRRAVEWAHSKGLKTYLHSCGDVNPFVPEFIDVGIEMLNPLEVKAGMDPLALKEQYGQNLAFHGGLNALLYDPPELMWAEMERVIPAMKEKGGYVIATDHSIPDNVSLDLYREFVTRAKVLGSYD